MRVVWEPNPELSRVQLAKAERLHWKNDVGIESFGDLVLPPDHRSGQRHPLVIVQYESRGFLRGGTGDEYPIQVLAANGFAVLSVQRPRDVAHITTRTIEEYERENNKGWADRRSVLSSVEKGVDLLEARGPHRPRAHRPQRPERWQLDCPVRPREQPPFRGGLDHSLLHGAGRHGKPVERRQHPAFSGRGLSDAGLPEPGVLEAVFVDDERAEPRCPHSDSVAGSRICDRDGGVRGAHGTRQAGGDVRVSK